MSSTPTIVAAAAAGAAAALLLSRCFARPPPPPPPPPALLPAGRRLAGKVALITGGGSGLGLAIARAFVAEGARVVLAARNLERLKAAVAELDSSIALALQCDVTDPASVAKMWADAAAWQGGVDICVNNSGLGANGVPTAELAFDDWNRVMSTNVTGVFLCAQQALKHMIPKKAGKILNIGSISAQMSRANALPYTASKFAVEGMTRSLALDARQHGIEVSVLHPGNAETAIFGKNLDTAKTNEGMMEPANVAQVALTIVSAPSGTNVLSSVVLPTRQPYLGRG